MALEEIRYHLRATLSDVGRGVHAEKLLVPVLHPSEQNVRLWLRVLAWALFYTPELTFGPGLSDPDAPALYGDDLTGRKAAWIVVNPSDPEKVRYAIRHNRGAHVGVAFGDERHVANFMEEVRGFKGLEHAEFVRIDESLLEQMAESLDERRYDVSITIVEDHLYVTAGKRSFEGTFRRSQGPPAS